MFSRVKIAIRFFFVGLVVGVLLAPRSGRATRRLLRVEIVDALQTDRVIQELMGKDPQARFRFIMERAGEAEELDL